MNVFLTAEKAKKQARILVDFLSSIRKGIGYGNALEAVARMYGAKEWNVLAANLADAPQEGPLGQPPMAKVNGKLYEPRVQAQLTSLDDLEYATFDATAWLLQASDMDIVALAEDRWTTHRRVDGLEATGGPGVRRVLAHAQAAAQMTHGDKFAGYRLTVLVDDALKLCRAFRYGLFVKLMLVRQFGTLEAAVGAGYEVFPDNEHPDNWVFVAAGEGSDIAYESADIAYRALGQQLEDEFRSWAAPHVFEVQPMSGFYARAGEPDSADTQLTTKVAGRYDVAGDSGEVLVLQPGQPHLTMAQLRSITEMGKYPVQVAVSINFQQLLDWNIEDLNDEVSERITGSCAGLEDIDYERFIPENEEGLHNVKDSVFIRVCANWSPMDGMYEEGEEGYDEGGDFVS